MTEPWLDRLSEYLDEDLDAAERRDLEAHLALCPSCAEALRDLRRVRDRARTLNDGPAPADLWRGIESRITRPRTIPRPEKAFARDRRQGEAGGPPFFTLPQLIAACLAVAVVSGGMVYSLMQGRGERVPATSPASTRISEPGTPGPATAPRPEEDRAPREAGPAVVVAAQPETPQEEAIAELRKALAKDRDRLDPATVRTLESNLAIIEIAIDQAKRALGADPGNPYVKQHLAETMQRKVELLQRATMLASASPEGNR